MVFGIIQFYNQKCICCTFFCIIFIMFYWKMLYFDMNNHSWEVELFNLDCFFSEINLQAHTELDSITNDYFSSQVNCSSFNFSYLSLIHWQIYWNLGIDQEIDYQWWKHTLKVSIVTCLCLNLKYWSSLQIRLYSIFYVIYNKCIPVFEFETHVFIIDQRFFNE